jgi:hypothetical protein
VTEKIRKNPAKAGFFAYGVADCQWHLVSNEWSKTETAIVTKKEPGNTPDSLKKSN